VGTDVTSWTVPPVDDEAVARAAAVICSGGLVAFPTETVYGLGADADDPAALRRIFAAKGRPPDHPLIVHLARADLLDDWASEVPDAARRLAAACWPGPLTLVLPRASRVVDEVTGGRPTVGLRVPGHPWALALLERSGTAIAAPSANRFGTTSPTTAEHVRAGLGEAVDLVLDGGHCPLGVESTIVDCTTDPPTVLRPGGVPAERLAEVLGRAPAVWGGEGPARAPGMLASHYAPRVRVLAVEGFGEVAPAVLAAPAGPVGILAPTPLPVDLVAGLDACGHDWVELEPVGGPEDYARRLYLRLHQADRLGLVVLVAVLPPAVGVGVAVRDRLTRAAAGS
jgi:L-threonylcarbamoyladenylate synthase